MNDDTPRRPKLTVVADNKPDNKPDVPRAVQEASDRLESNVVALDVPTSVELPASKVLESALKADLETVVVIGYRREGKGDPEYFASTTSDVPEMIFLVERFKFYMMHVYDSGEPPEPVKS